MGEEHQEFLEELGAYLVGGLAPDEIGAIRRHLEECAECRTELGALDGLNELLEAASLTEAPPPELEDRIMAAIDGEAVLAKRRRGLAAIDAASDPADARSPGGRRVSLGGLAMAAAFFFIMGIGVALLFGTERGNDGAGSNPPSPIPSSAAPTSLPPLKLLAATSPTTSPAIEPTATIQTLRMVAGGELTPVASGDAWECELAVWGLNRGQLYEVWFRGDGGWVSAGTFRVTSIEHRIFRVTTGAHVKTASQVMVTAEEDDGDAEPSNRIILTGGRSR